MQYPLTLALSPKGEGEKYRMKVGRVNKK